MTPPELHPAAAAIAQLIRSREPLHSLPVEEARRRMRAQLVRDVPTPVALSEDLVAEGPGQPVPCRLYHPDPSATLPLLVFMHGGGWILNDLDTHDGLCALLAGTGRYAVLSVDYRRSPEHVYPAALDDATTALRWAVAHRARLGVDPARIAVGGDSAGGNLAAALSVRCRDAGGPAVAGQLLFYPVTDHAGAGWASYAEHGTGYLLSSAMMDWSFSAYLPADWQADNPLLFPLHGDQCGLPPTVLVTAEFDPLRDEGRAYAESLAAAGIEVHHVHAADQMHGFATQTAAIPTADSVVRRASAQLATLLR